MHLITHPSTHPPTHPSSTCCETTRRSLCWPLRDLLQYQSKLVILYQFHPLLPRPSKTPQRWWVKEAWHYVTSPRHTSSPSAPFHLPLGRPGLRRQGGSASLSPFLPITQAWPAWAPEDTSKSDQGTCGIRAGAWGSFAFLRAEGSGAGGARRTYH